MKFERSQPPSCVRPNAGSFQKRVKGAYPSLVSASYTSFLSLTLRGGQVQIGRQIRPNDSRNISDCAPNKVGIFQSASAWNASGVEAYVYVIIISFQFYGLIMRWAEGTGIRRELHPLPAGAAPSLGDKRLGHVKSGAGRKSGKLFRAIKSTRDGANVVWYMPHDAANRVQVE